jgi:adenine C2-methylase RlmN of 23S rRNA A2503 and tRNA A37
MKFILTGLLLLAVSVGFCQTGTVVINDQAGAGQLIEQHVLFNKEHGELPGYRIQVMATAV